MLYVVSNVVHYFAAMSVLLEFFSDRDLEMTFKIKSFALSFHQCSRDISAANK